MNKNNSTDKNNPFSKLFNNILKTLKLKNIKIQLSKLTKNKISTQPQAIRHFIEKMDIEMIDAFLDNDKTYQDFKKEVFISRLQQAFEEFKSFGDTHLNSIEGSCNRCDKTKTGFTFIGNNSNNYMDIIFDTTDNKIEDLYQCVEFKKCANLKCNNNVYIDELRFLPL